MKRYEMQNASSEETEIFHQINVSYPLEMTLRQHRRAVVAWCLFECISIPLNWHECGLGSLEWLGVVFSGFGFELCVISALSLTDIRGSGWGLFFSSVASMIIGGCWIAALGTRFPVCSSSFRSDIRLIFIVLSASFIFLETVFAAFAIRRIILSLYSRFCCSITVSL